MTPAQRLLLRIYRLGVIISLDPRGDLTVDGPERAMSQDLLDLIKVHKAGLGEALRDPKETAYRALEETVADVARLWEKHAVQERGRGREALWLDRELDIRLLDETGERVKAGDLQGTLRAADLWKTTWLALLRPGHGSCALASPSSPQSLEDMGLDLVAERRSFPGSEER